MLPSMFFSGQLFVILSRKIFRKKLFCFLQFFLSASFSKYFVSCLKFLINGFCSVFCALSIGTLFGIPEAHFKGEKCQKVRSTIRFQRPGVVVFSIKKSGAFRIRRKKDIVEEIERSSLYKMV